MYEEAVLAAVSTMVIGVALILDDKKKKKRRNRTIWVQEWIKQREEHGAYHALVNELCLSAREDYRSFMRMNTETFTELIDKIRPYISKQTTVMRKPINRTNMFRHFYIMFISFLQQRKSWYIEKPNVRMINE